MSDAAPFGLELALALAELETVVEILRRVRDSEVDETDETEFTLEEPEVEDTLLADETLDAVDFVLTDELCDRIT